MSTYVREKVLRIPMDKIDFSGIREQVYAKFSEEDEEDIDDDFSYYLEKTFPELFDYATEGKFQFAPTEDSFMDYVLEYEYDCDGEYGKTRELYPEEIEYFKPVFQKLDANVDMTHVRLVEFCWYNGTEAPSYYGPEDDPFYKSIVSVR